MHCRLTRAELLAVMAQPVACALIRSDQVAQQLSRREGERTQAGLLKASKDLRTFLFRDARGLLLRIQNSSRIDVAVLRWYALYDVRLLDSEGRVVWSSGRNLERNEHFKWFREADWVVLGQDDEVSFRILKYPLPPRAKEGQAVTAECHMRQGQAYAVSKDLPTFVQDAGANYMLPMNTPRISL
jgi:hypothetical protein